MKYEKPHLSYEDQADLLISRGLQADKDVLLHRLQSVSYYRLSGYLYPFRQPDSDDFVEGANLDEVWQRYCFDRRLRVLIIDAAERIEVAVRSRLIYHFSETHGAFGYLDNRNLPNLKIERYLDWRSKLLEETQRSKERFKKAFFDKYKEHHQELPIWMLAELMSMGSCMTFLKGAPKEIKQKVAADFGLVDKVLESWLLSLNAARNICAHHARFWNRDLGYSPILPNPKKFPAWYTPEKVSNTKPIAILYICRVWLDKISPTSKWHERVETLFSEYPSVPITSIGMTPDWNTRPLWTTPNL